MLSKVPNQIAKQSAEKYAKQNTMLITDLNRTVNSNSQSNTEVLLLR